MPANQTKIDLNLRLAYSEDVPELLDMVNSRSFSSDGSGSLLPLSASAIQKVIDQQGFFVAEARHQSGSQVIGCASIVEYDGLVELRSLVVRPEFRSMGVARALLDMCVEAAHARGYAKLHALVNEEALSVFFRLGFASTHKPPAKLDKDCKDCPLHHSDKCREVAVVRDLRANSPPSV